MERCHKLTSFKLNVSEQELTDLHARLAAARWPDALENIAPWEDGTELPYLKTFVDYWRHSYDWRAWEAKLNGMSQFTTHVGGVMLHFVHERSSRADAVPLLLLHGWPGSFFEFYKLIPMLKADGRFHIVVPSLPGYGLSSAPRQRGYGVTAIAGCMDSLMAGLGYSRYLAQGGDWGALVCRALAKYHANSCAAIHINMCFAAPNLYSPLHLAQLANAMLVPSLPLLLNEQELRGLQDLRLFRAHESAYAKIQGTKPQTLAYALHDSPLGLAAWILEKFRTWSDCGGVPDGAFSKDELLTNVCLYWFGGRIASSMRLYKETLANKLEMQCLMSGRSTPPTAVAIFPKEMMRPPQSWARSTYNLVRWTEMPAGGHFAALEQPRLLADDLFRFEEQLRAMNTF